MNKSSRKRFRLLPGAHVACTGVHGCHPLSIKSSHFSDGDCASPPHRERRPASDLHAEVNAIGRCAMLGYLGGTLPNMVWSGKNI